ncbi:MAG: Hsp20/alpha crystallin family protein [Bacteroidales bacterium]|nr:Hsp20/alpha crystallin family protein [Bacteroidales bacterium]
MEDKAMTLLRFSNVYPRLIDPFNDDEMSEWSNRHYSNTNTTLPSANIKEDVDGFEVELAAPGFDKGDFKIDLDKDVLTISSVKQVENETNEGQRFTLREFSYQSFSRSFTLPNIVDNDKIAAKYENGILRISIPKKEEAKPKPARQIEVL